MVAWQTSESAGDALADLRVVKAGRREIGFKVRCELPEVPTQPVREAAAFGHDLVAVVVEDADLERLLVQVRDRERVDPFSERGARDRGRVDRIGLPRLAYCPPGGLGQPRRDADDSVTAGEKPALQPAGHVPAVLDRPHALGVELCGEPQRQKRAVVRRRDRQLPARRRRLPRRARQACASACVCPARSRTTHVVDVLPDRVRLVGAPGELRGVELEVLGWRTQAGETVLICRLVDGSSGTVPARWTDLPARFPSEPALGVFATPAGWRSLSERLAGLKGPAASATRRRLRRKRR